MFRTIVVPLDGTPQAACALPVARAVARITGGELVLARVATPADVEGEPERYLRAVAREAVGLARAIGARLELVQAMEPVPMWIYGADYGGALVYLDGDWEDEALRAAQGYVGADLIVMSTHALTGPARTLIGSTADALVRTARRPVLLVRRPGGHFDDQPPPDARLLVAAGTHS